MAMIYHITPRAVWEATQGAGVYRTESLESEGFIHCSRRDQVVAVADANFHGQTGLALLAIDEARVAPEIRYEDCYDTGQAFPHIYGPLELNAVTQVFDFPSDASGRFALPDEI
ncbi:MAG: DUF952 domain-containing protein [Chloroflexi bacterium]|nr:DUF952 domain-containing protein [Chloroflexota bacterium]